MYRHRLLETLLASLLALLARFTALYLLGDLIDFGRYLLNIQILTIQNVDLVTRVVLLHLSEPVTLR